jgi:hypothetical protein
MTGLLQMENLDMAICDLLYDPSVSALSDDVQKEVEAFSLQVRLEKVQVCGCGFVVNNEITFAVRRRNLLNLD